MSKEWPTKLRKFKHGLKLRARLGAFDSICEQANAGYPHQRLNWDDPKWVDIIYTAIQTETFPPELIRRFAITPNVVFWYYLHVTPAGILKTAEDVLNRFNVELHTRFYTSKKGV